MQNYFNTLNQTVFPVSKWLKPLHITTVEIQQKAEAVINAPDNDSDSTNEVSIINPVKTEGEIIVRVNTNQSITIKPWRSFFGETNFSYDITNSRGNVISQTVVFVTVIKNSSVPAKQ